MIAQGTRKVRVLAAAFALLVLAAGCASHAPASHGPAASSRTVAAAPGERAARVALDQVGVPYRYGGNTPSGFDCSGLVQYAYSRAGVAVPRTTRQLWATAKSVDLNQLRAGDVLFFDIEGKMSHVGLYLGEQRFVHAPSTGQRVSIASLEADFYRDALLRAGRLY